MTRELDGDPPPDGDDSRDARRLELDAPVRAKSVAPRAPSLRPSYRYRSNPPPAPEPSTMQRWGRRVVVAGIGLFACYLGVSFFSSSLDYERIGPRPAAGRKLVMLLHGAGAPGDDLVPFASELSAQLPQTTFFVPVGPHRVSLGGRAWIPSYTAPSRAEYAVRLAREVDDSARLVLDLIRSAKRRGIACRDLYLGGFSQGGRMAVEVALRAPRDCALGGVIVMSGGGLDELDLPNATRDAPMRVLVTHGTSDQVVPFPVGRATATHLARAGHDVRFLSFPGPHTIAAIVREAVPKFLRGEAVGEPVSP